MDFCPNLEAVQCSVCQWGWAGILDPASLHFSSSMCKRVSWMSSVRELLDSWAHYSPSVPVISTDPSLIRPEIGIWIMAMRYLTQGNSHRNRDSERWGVVRETGERERSSVLGPSQQGPDTVTLFILNIF